MEPSSSSLPSLMGAPSHGVAAEERVDGFGCEAPALANPERDDLARRDEAFDGTLRDVKAPSYLLDGEQRRSRVRGGDGTIDHHLDDRVNHRHEPALGGGSHDRVAGLEQLGHLFGCELTKYAHGTPRRNTREPLAPEYPLGFFEGNLVHDRLHWNWGLSGNAYHFDGDGPIPGIAGGSPS